MEIIVSALLKLISVLKLKLQRIREHYLVGRNGSIVPHWLQGSNKQLRPCYLQTAGNSFMGKFSGFVLFYLLQLCLDQFSCALPSAGCYHPSNEHWNGSCSAPHSASAPSQVVRLKLLLQLKMVCSEAESSRNGSGHTALPPQPCLQHGKVASSATTAVVWVRQS